MSEKPQDWDRSRDEIISGEYVLGVLSEEDRRRVEARMRSDPKFAQQVRRWQTNLADFNEDYVEATPPAQLYNTIEARLFGIDRGARGYMLGNLWNSILLWRGLALGAVVVAAGIVVFDRVETKVPPTHGKPLVAELTGMDSPISLIARYDAASGRLAIIPAALSQEQPKSLELWLVEDDKTTKSLGILKEGGDGDIVVPADLRGDFAAGRTLAISVEPLGGSPEGKPTGPIVALGKTKLLTP